MGTPDVAIITPYPSTGRLPSGVAAYSASLTRALREAGAEVAVVAPADDDPSKPARGEPGILRPFRRGPSALPVAARAAHATGAPAVHLQHETFLYGGPSALPGLVGALASLRGAGRRAVVTMHHVVDPAEVDADFTRSHRVRVPAPVARAGLAAVQHTVGRLASDVIVHEPRFGRVVPRARIVPHGVESVETADRGAAQERLGVDDGRLVVLCFGFLAPYKGLETALAASALAGDHVHLVIAGGEHPRLAEEYGERLRELAPAGTTFTGYVPDEDVADWFAAADVALLPYPRPFASSGPLALALAHGTPVLMSEALARTTGAPGALAVSADPAAIAGRLGTLAADGGERERLRAAARGLSTGRTWPEIARRHLALYGRPA